MCYGRIDLLYHANWNIRYIIVYYNVIAEQDTGGGGGLNCIDHEVRVIYPVLGLTKFMCLFFFILRYFTTLR